MGGARAYIPIRRKHKYLAPSQNDLSHTLVESSRIGHKLVIQVKRAHFCDISFTRIRRKSVSER